MRTPGLHLTLAFLVAQSSALVLQPVHVRSTAAAIRSAASMQVDRALRGLAERLQGSTRVSKPHGGLRASCGRQFAVGEAGA